MKIILKDNFTLNDLHINWSFTSDIHTCLIMKEKSPFYEKLKACKNNAMKVLLFRIFFTDKLPQFVYQLKRMQLAGIRKRTSILNSPEFQCTLWAGSQSFAFNKHQIISMLGSQPEYSVSEAQSAKG